MSTKCSLSSAPQSLASDGASLCAKLTVAGTAVCGVSDEVFLGAVVLLVMKQRS